MEYLILSLATKVSWEGGCADSISYVCVNNISRCKNTQGEDVLQYVSSGIGQQVLMKDVIAITPATPTGSAIAELRK